MLHGSESMHRENGGGRKRCSMHNDAPGIWQCLFRPMGLTNGRNWVKDKVKKVLYHYADTWIQSRGRVSFLLCLREGALRHPF